MTTCKVKLDSHASKLVALVALTLSFFTLVSIGLSDYQQSQGVSVLLNATGMSYFYPTANISYNNSRTINFTYNVTWNQSYLIQNVTLWGNFSGSTVTPNLWGANTTNGTAFTNATGNGTIGGLVVKVNATGAFNWTINVTTLFNGATPTFFLADTNWTYILDEGAPRLENTSRSMDGLDNSTDNATYAYAPGRSYIFNVSAFDFNSSISQVLLNFSYAPINYTATRIGSTYNYSVTVSDLPVGKYSYKWFANDGAGNWNSTKERLFNITQNTTAPVTLLLNGVANQNTSATYADGLNATIVAQGIQTATMYMDLNASGSWANSTTLHGTDLDPDGGTWMNVTNRSTNNLDVPNGTYAFIVNVTGSLNYTQNATGANYSIVLYKSGLSIALAPTTQSMGETSMRMYCAVNSTNWLGTLWRNGANLTVSNDSVSVPSAGTYVFGCNVTAPVANYSYTNQSSTLTVTATSTTSPGTSSASASTATTTATTQTIASLLAGVPKVINEVSLPSDAKLTSIQLTTNTAATSVQLAVQSYASKPADVATAAAPDVYKYVSVSFTNLATNNVQAAKIAFKVEKSWLTLKGISVNDVAMYRYTGGAWTLLSTSKTSEDGIYAYYQATTSGFSYFAIGGQASSVTPTTTTTTSPAGAEATTTTVPEAVTTTTAPIESGAAADYTWVWVIVVVAAVAAIAVAWKSKMFGLGTKAWNKQ